MEQTGGSEMKKKTGREMLVDLGYTLLTNTEEKEISKWRKVESDGTYFEIYIRCSDGAFISFCEGKPCWISLETSTAICQHVHEWYGYKPSKEVNHESIRKIPHHDG